MNNTFLSSPPEEEEQMPSAGCFPGDKNCTITGGRKRKTIRKRRRKTIRRRRMTKRKRRSLK